MPGSGEGALGGGQFLQLRAENAGPPPSRRRDDCGRVFFPGVASLDARRGTARRERCDVAAGPAAPPRALVCAGEREGEGEGEDAPGARSGEKESAARQERPLGDTTTPRMGKSNIIYTAG